MNILRPASEPEVISEFLRSEFHHREYHHDRRQCEPFVLLPDLSNPHENALRRELHYRRHAATWGDLPPDIAWIRASVNIDDLSRIHVSPRRPWPAVAPGTALSVTDVVSSIRQGRFAREASREVAAIQLIAYRIRRQPLNLPVLLVGLDPASPLTILDGNRRLIAAVLAAGSHEFDFQVYCGLSPRMTECFCYRNSPENFLRHYRDRLSALQPTFFKTAVTRWSSLATRLAQVW